MITVLGFDNAPADQRSIDASAGRFIKTLLRAVLSGNYATGGDTLDFSNVGGSAASPSTIPPGAVSIAKVEVVSNGPAASVGANGGNYEYVPGTTILNGKLKIFATAGTEYAAGAYGADATTDKVLVEVWWTRV